MGSIPACSILTQAYSSGYINLAARVLATECILQHGPRGAQGSGELGVLLGSECHCEDTTGAAVQATHTGTGTSSIRGTYARRSSAGAAPTETPPRRLKPMSTRPPRRPSTGRRGTPTTCACPPTAPSWEAYWTVKFQFNVSAAPQSCRQGCACAAGPA